MINKNGSKAAMEGNVNNAQKNNRYFVKMHRNINMLKKIVD